MKYNNHMVTFDEENSDDRIHTLHGREEEELAQALAERDGVPYLDLAGISINIDALRILKEDASREAGIAVFDVTDKNLKVAALSPNNEKTRTALEDLKTRGYAVDMFMVSHASLNKVYDRYKDLSYSFETKSGALDISNDEILKIMKEVHTITDVKTQIETVLGAKQVYRVSKILEIILAGAIALGVSDVHIEPEDKEVRLRYRLDGVLTDILFFETSIYDLLVSRVKLISELKLNVKDKAQDGRFSIVIKDQEIEIRTSLLPGPYGESIVLRVLNPDAIAVELESLGIHPRLLEVLSHEIKKPNGMILTTGPTGSGKTTTLYAFLKKIYTPDIKVITIENPIEYHITGIVQTQTDNEKGYTFAEGLRSALRQDPDVIMVGEIRDNETAEVAVNASLTGHLVLSTLHTNNAAGAFPRLIDLGVNPKVISSALSISIAQRLVRQLCPKCKKEIVLEGKDKETIEKILAGIIDQTYLEGVDRTKAYTAVGCTECHEGYKGRIGIFEAVLVDAAIEKAVVLNPSERDIREAAKPQNMLTLVQDGVLKVLTGITTLSELERVVDLSAIE
ncbi:MAG: pilB1 [Parcubacteria group bacterium]|nr:pilB1 [Parcubacteria group bacterium]